MNELITFNERSVLKKIGALFALFRSIHFSQKLSFLVLTFLFSFSTMNAQEYGIEVENGVGTIYFEDQGWTGGWNYICLGSDCNTGEKSGSRWVREVPGLTVGQTYTIQLKIQDNANGQYISPEYTVTSVAKDDSSNPDPIPTCDDGIQNGDETGIDCGGSCAPCQVTPPPVASRKVEVEMATVLGGASIYDDTSASNGKGIAYISSQGAGFSIANTPSASSVEIVYASELEGEISIFIDGVDQGNIPFTSTGGWVGTYQTATYTIDIQQGSTFEMIFQTGDAALNVDYVNFVGEAGEPLPCTGLNSPSSIFNWVATTNETSDGALDGTVTFSFDNVTNDYDSITFILGSTSYTTALSDQTLLVQNVAAGDYPVSIQWSNGDCTSDLGTVTVGSCENGVRDGNETQTDCGGVCPVCTDEPLPTEDLVISVAISPSHGEYLVAQYGEAPPMTIYTWTNDNSEFTNCTGGCDENWPYVVTDTKADLVLPPTLPSGLTGEFGLSGTCDGQLQLTFDGNPLYYYVGDNVEGDVNGEGAGNEWFIVKEVATNTCSDGIQNGDETGVDCGGSCTPCSSGSGQGSCSDFGLTIIDGQGVLYFNEDLGSASYLCLNGQCYPPDVQEDGYYKRFVTISTNTDYTIKVQGSNEQEKVAQVAQCYFVPTCNDGIQNGDETGVDCGGSCGDCPTCEDGIQNGDETGVDCGGANCISCEEVCNGTPNPNATLQKTNESVENLADGTITFVYEDVIGREVLEFSIDGGQTYPYARNDNSEWFTVADLAPGTYPIKVRWGNGGDCPINLGEITILEGGAAPTCSDGILNQGETRVDCGGPCQECGDDPCGDIPLVLYPSPALPTPVIGVAPGTHGYTFDLAEDYSKVSVSYGQTIGIQAGGDPDFEFFCSCNQIEFEGIKLNETGEVPSKCKDAGNFYYFFRYKKQGYMTDDPGDQYMYSSLFTTEGERIDPRTRPTISSLGANWMRFRHPHAYDGITEAIFDAVHNADQLRYLDRYETIITDGPDNLRIDPQLTSANGTFHPHTGADVTVVRIDILDIGDSPAPRYATTVGGVSGTTYADLGPGYNYGNMVNYEITAVAGGSGAQTYNTLQNYFIGQGFNTHGDPRLASAGKASTLMILPSLQTAGFNERNYNLERDAIFTQHSITVESEDDVDDFLEGHHLFHGVVHRSEAGGYNQYQVDLGEAKIGSTTCGTCHFRDGRGPEVIQTPRGPRLPPAVYGVGFLQWIAGAEVGLRWDGGVETVEEQTRNALIEDHGIDPDTDISQEDLEEIIAYTKFLTVPTRSANSYNIPGVAEGELAFNQVGCASCHQVAQKTRSDAPKEFRDIVIRPYTDMKLHNVNNGNFRTPALWGIGRNIDLLERNGHPTLFMHDGSASSLEEAIQKHGGDASGVRAAYNALSEEEKSNIVKFIKTL